MNRNDNTNPNLPADAEKWANEMIPEPYDPKAPSFFDRLMDFLIPDQLPLL